MLRTPGYWIASIILLGIFGFVWWASMTGYGLSSTAAALAERKRSARVGSYGSRYVGGGGPRFGK